jgi:uncharacterized protein
VRVVLDTNILVSGFMSFTSPPALILNALRTGQIVAVISEATLAELEAVLRRPAIRRYLTRVGIRPAEWLADFRVQADLVTPVTSTAPIRDECDRVFLNLLATSPQPCYFVTGDKDFDAPEYSGVPVISAADFVRLLKRL